MGRSIGAYELGDVLGRGGTGVVYKARHRTLGRDVALKLIHGDGLADSPTTSWRDKLRREAIAVAQLEHPNIARLYEFSEEGGEAFLVFELVRGDALSTVLTRQGPLAPARALAIVEKVARALHHAHERGLIHRDVKPGNILLDEQGEPHLVDFGLARRIDGAGGVTRSGVLVGTPSYLAPEQARGDNASVDRRTDIWGLGVTLHELLTGNMPFGGANLIDMLRAITEDPPARLTGLVGEGADRARQVVQRALEKDPDDRPQTALELARLCVPPGEEPPSAARSPLRFVALVLAVGVAAAASVVGGIVVGRSSAPERPRQSPAAASPSPVAFATPSTAGPTIATPARPPAWYLALPASERPALPLREGIVFGKEPGEYVNAADESVLVYVPGGVFLMGRDETGLETSQPVHEVELRPFFVGKLETSNREFARFCDRTGYRTLAEVDGVGFRDRNGGARDSRDKKVPGASWRYPDGPGTPAPGPDLPVVQVAWLDAHAYVEWARLRLPSEAEWERAAIWDAPAKRSLRYAFGDDAPGTGGARPANVFDASRARKLQVGELVASDYEDGYPDAAPVRSFPQGASPVGALHMTGNVCEWCQDAWDPSAYRKLPRSYPLNDAPPAREVRRVVRGGSYLTHPSAKALAGAYRDGGGRWADDLGFRVACDARE